MNFLKTEITINLENLHRSSFSVIFSFEIFFSIVDGFFVLYRKWNEDLLRISVYTGDLDRFLTGTFPVIKSQLSDSFFPATYP